ncbi:MAG: histidinol-phosphate transaminase [Trueperella sp.]|nr:histidinol-phosphate transaminase [Trueperella sp.]
MILPTRPELAQEKPYGAPQLDVPVCLNVNENPYDPSPELVQQIASEVAKAAAQLNRYPDRDFTALRTDLAAYLAEESGVQLDITQLWAANGSNEVMLHILQAFAGPGRTVASFLPSYSMYPEYARDVHSTWVAGQRNADFSLNFVEVQRVLAGANPAVILLASPNNPTGTALPFDQLRQVLELAIQHGPQLDVGNGEVEKTAALVVVDEAYAEFRRDGVPSALELLAEYPNLVVTRTMSKAFGAAGLRLGYMAASPEIVDQIRIVRLPYHLSAVTQAAARGALAQRAELSKQVAQIRADRDQLAESLRALGWEVAESDANFVMFGHLEDRHQVWQGLLDRGVLIREVGPDGWLRVSIGTPEENAAFLTALQEVTK